MRKLRWLGPVLALALVAAACGDDDDDDGGDAATGTSAAAAEETTTSAAGGTATTAAEAEGEEAVEAGGETFLGTGIPSGDACPNVPISGVNGVTDDEILIGGLVAITNPSGQPYEDAVDGLLAYIKGVNDAGGVCGRQIKYSDTVNDQSAVSRNLLGARQLVEDTEVFAIAPAVTSTFGSGQYLADTDVPVFGWNINPEWSLGDNMFGEKGSFVCFAGFNADECPNEDVVWMASELVGATKVAVLNYGSAPSSAACGLGQELSFQRWGATSGVEFAFRDDSLAFGFSPESLGPTLDRIRSEGVDMLFTCMDVAANIRVLTAMQNAGLDTAMYWPNGYDRDVLNEFGDQIQNYVVTGSFFRPFEVEPSPGMESYQATMEANDLKISELTLSGWINGDLLVTGIRAAAGTEGTFDQKAVVDAINGLTYNAGGILPDIVWKDFHTGPRAPVNCYAYMKVDGATKTFIPEAPDVSKPWICFDTDPEKVSPQTYEYRTFGEEDTGLSTEAVQGTEEAVDAGGEVAQPADPAAAEAAITELATAYLAAQTIDERLPLVANGESVRAEATQAFRPGLVIEPLNLEITFTGESSADLAFGIKLNGNELPGVRSTAYVVNVDGEWKWHPFAVCDGITGSGNAALGAQCLENAEAP
jgi:ABC-type branched-subunit amino acid transport system substrate-binding protein